MEEWGVVQEWAGCGPVVARLLWARGFRTREAVEKLLQPKLSDLPHPFRLTDLEKAAARVAQWVIGLAIEGDPFSTAHKAYGRIAIYGDYDVDGTCGAAMLVEFFQALGVEPLVYQPNRFTEGYGVHPNAVEQLADQGAKILITVDCGITGFAAAEVAQARGVDFIVLDHHKVAARLPEAFAVVNPQRMDDESGLQNLCGTGVAFFFLMGLRVKLREGGFFSQCPEPQLRQWLDLVALATVADVVDVTGVNRILLWHGLQVLRQSSRLGIRAILEANEIRQVNEVHCGFVLGPRINAAGRLEHANAALRLLTTKEDEEARKFADELERLNRQRRETQDEVVSEAQAEAERVLSDPMWAELAREHSGALAGPWPRALVLYQPHWHEGVLGIVASKIVERFRRPVFILSAKETAPEMAKGSARSFNKIDITAMLSVDSVKRCLANFGGHAHAAGVSLACDRLQQFSQALNLAMANRVTAIDYTKEARFDLELQPREIEGTLLNDLEQLGPFGPGFPEPAFKLGESSLLDFRVLKEKHLKFRVGDRFGPEAVWFNVPAEELNHLVSLSEAQRRASCWVSLKWNEYRGRRSQQMQIKSIEICR